MARPDRVYCSEEAQKAGAKLFGSAVPVDIWLLLEYPRPWAPKALDDNDLSPAVNAHMSSLAEACAQDGVRLRIQFIKQAASADMQKPRVYLADTRVGSGVLVAGELARYEQFTEITAAGVLAHELPDGQQSTDNMYLVCTNGQRDLCCARFGLPLYEALRLEQGGTAWQTTHVGGHRFAPNLVCLPSGISYGFVEPERASELIACHEAGEVDLTRLRGRSSFSEAMQAADYFVRRDSGYKSIDPLEFEVVNAGEDGAFRLKVSGPRQGTIEVKRVVLDEPALASCGAEPKRVEEYELLELTLE